MTQIFLGYPPEHIKNWIIEHSRPVGNPKTKITFKNGTSQEYDWSGEISQQTMIDAGLCDRNKYTWVKEPKTVEFGTQVTGVMEYVFSECASITGVTIPNSVTRIREGAFFRCSGLTSVTIPSSVASIGDMAFGDCSRLTSVTFSGKDMASVQNMANHYWGLKSGCVIHCTDGDIQL